ncbi:MAG: lipid-binding SYLF domain-containing protein, partial [Pseudomonadota bacterium]
LNETLLNETLLNETLRPSGRFDPVASYVSCGAALGLGAGVAAAPKPALAKSAVRISQEVLQAREEMFRFNPITRRYYESAVATLIIPRITKGALILGGAYGEGQLIKDDRIHSYWYYGAASFGFQGGVQEVNQALFFMTEDAFQTFLAREGLELGADAEIAALDLGAEVAIDTTKDTKPVISYVFGRGGVFAGASLQGGKYSRFTPGRRTRILPDSWF